MLRPSFFLPKIFFFKNFFLQKYFFFFRFLALVRYEFFLVRYEFFSTILVLLRLCDRFLILFIGIKWRRSHPFNLEGSLAPPRRRKKLHFQADEADEGLEQDFLIHLDPRPIILFGTYSSKPTVLDTYARTVGRKII